MYLPSCCPRSTASHEIHTIPPLPPQILTHVREKLQFIEKENAALDSALNQLEAELADKRDRLGRAKAERDTLRAKGRKIKESGSNITSPQLLDDIEVRRRERCQVTCVRQFTNNAVEL